MPVPNALTDGSYDSPGDPNYGAGSTVSAAEVLARQQHPEILQDPTVLAAATPADRERAIAASLKKVDPSYDPNGVYQTSPDGSLTPNTGSWFSDHLPLISALILGGTGIGGLAAAGAFGGAGAAGAAGASALGPSTAANIAATTAATAAPAGIAASVAPAAAGTFASLLGKQGLSAIGAGASKLAGNLASDRGSSASLTLDAQRQFENELMTRQQNARASQADALKQSIFGSLLQGYQPAPRPAGIPASPFANGLGATGNQATSFIAQDALKRLQAGDQLPPLQPLDVSQYTSPSIWEKLLGLGGAAATAYGAYGGKK